MKHSLITVAGALICLSGMAAEPAVTITAYINQASGCQVHTEAFLASLARKHGERVALELVDFGREKGRRRWKADGMSCMAICVNGSTTANIVCKGAELAVRFDMPAGFKWRHEELAIAVRQLLDGVADSDRRPPTVDVVREGSRGILRIDGRDAVALGDVERLTACAKALREADPKVILQEEFGPARDGDSVSLVLRKKQILTLTSADAEVDGQTIEQFAGRCFGNIAGAYPRRKRPFPGVANPHGRGGR